MRLLQDLRHAARTLARTPVVTAVALLTLALGIAGPTAMFSMIRAWILDPLPFEQPDALVDVRKIDTVSGTIGTLSPADFLDWTRTMSSFADFAAYHIDEVRLTGADHAERLSGARVTSNFFEVLRAKAEVGRLFGASEREPGPHPVAVISHGLWRERFSADPAIIGRAVRLDGTPHTVIGVLPESFHFTLVGRANVFVPLVFTAAQAVDHRSRYIIGLGRLRPDHTIVQARDELTRSAGQLAKAFPDTNATRGVRVVRLAQEIRRHHDAGFLLPVIFAMVMCVLLVACVNVTNVMLARASARRHEVAVRLALGASRARIVRQWLIEHLVLFVGAGALGATLSVVLTDWITNSIPFENRGYLRNYGVVPVDRGVLLFALATGAGCGALFGWLVAWTSATDDVNANLRDGSERTATAARGSRLRGVLVVGQLALALGLLISAGLLVQTARNVTEVAVGFDPRRVLTFQIALDEQHYVNDDSMRTFFDRLTERLARHPEVEGAAAGSLVPFAGGGMEAEFFPEGRPDPKPGETLSAALNQCTAQYARIMRLRLSRGRLLTAQDTADRMKAAMINDTLAARYFGDRDPIGQRLRLGRESQDFWTIVGVIGDVKNYESMDPPAPQIYVPFSQRPSRQATVVVRSAAEPGALVGLIRNDVAALDPAEPVSRVFTMEALISHVTAPYQTTSTFISLFGALTLLLAGVGVYGVVSYTFARRTREIGIRMALGAARSDIAALVVKQVRTFLLAGLVPGLALALALGQALKGFLVGVTPTDWRLFVGVPLLLTIVVLLAALVPARRATAINPTAALRCE